MYVRSSKVLWRKRETGSNGAGGDCNDQFLMGVGFSVGAAFDQHPEEQKEPFMQVSGRKAVQTQGCGWRRVRWREEEEIRFEL